VHPEASRKLLDMLTEVSIRYLVGQVRAGAQLLQVFDSWAGELAPHTFNEFALPCLRKIARDVRQHLTEAGLEPVPMIVFAKGARPFSNEAGRCRSGRVLTRDPHPYSLPLLYPAGAHYALAELADSGYDVVGLDWTIDHRVARAAVGDRVTLQGNLDPCTLYATPEVIRAEVAAMLQRYGARAGVSVAVGRS